MAPWAGGVGSLQNTTTRWRAESRQGWDSSAGWLSTPQFEVSQGLRRWARLEDEDDADVDTGVGVLTDFDGGTFMNGPVPVFTFTLRTCG